MKSSKSRKRSFSGQCLRWCPVFAALCLFIFMLANHFSGVQVSAPAGLRTDVVSVDPSIMNLIRLQNETITSLRVRLKQVESFGKPSAQGDRSSESQKLEMMYAELAKKQNEIDELKSAAKIDTVTYTSSAKTSHAEISPTGESRVSHTQSLPVMMRSDFEEECENRFGLGLSDRWRERKEEWCASSTNDETASSIHCYPYQQEHKKTGRRAQRDMFCEGRNIFIDFSKVSGTHGKTKPPLGSQYLSFDKGSTFASCQKTGKWTDSLFMPHMSRQFGQMHFGKSVKEDEFHEGSTYLLARDEDCENMFHSSADHINIFNVAQILGLDFETLQVVLFDKHFDGPFHDLISTAFSPNHPLKRIGDYHKKVVRFKHLVWHLESPAGIVFPKVGGPTGLMQCTHSSLWDGYRKQVLHKFGLLNVPPPSIPTVLLSFRRRTAQKNVGRVFQDESVLTDVLKQGNMMVVNSLDLGSVSFREQLKLVRSCNIMVGAHGAGLMHVIFMADEGVLVEIHPSYRLDRHFRLASRMTGKVYLPMRSTSPVTCRGSSDAIPVDKSEFRRTMDAALRIARSFDDGASECGLNCDPQILALDKGNDPFYSQMGIRKAAPLSTKFPCH